MKESHNNIHGFDKNSFASAIITKEEVFSKTKFFVYWHMRPDMSVFYVGKGTKERAFYFAKSRRSDHHRNIVKKYGLENIHVKLFPCINEKEAFMLEIAHIAIHRQISDICNITSGGEGSSGYKYDSDRLKLHSEACKRGWDKRGRLLRPEKQAIYIDCLYCKKRVEAKSSRKKFCDDICQQRYSRANLPKNKTKVYKNNSSGVTGVYLNKRTGSWVSMISKNGKLICVGTFKDFKDAVSARKNAEKLNGSRS